MVWALKKTRSVNSSRSCCSNRSEVSSHQQGRMNIKSCMWASLSAHANAPSIHHQLLHTSKISVMSSPMNWAWTGLALQHRLAACTVDAHAAQLLMLCIEHLISSLCCTAHVCCAVRKRIHMQQEMQAEHKVTSAVRADNRRAESQLLQARQVSHQTCMIAVKYENRHGATFFRI